MLNEYNNVLGKTIYYNFNIFRILKNINSNTTIKYSESKKAELKQSELKKAESVSILPKTINQTANNKKVIEGVSKRKNLDINISYIKKFIIKIIENKFNSVEKFPNENNSVGSGKDIQNYILQLLDSFILNNHIISRVYTKSELNLFKKELIKNNFYKNIKDFIDNKYIEKFTKNQQSELSRGSYRINNIKKYVLNKSRSLDPKIFKLESYLDIGCFDGGITESIGTYFHLDKTQIYGVDIKKYKSDYEFNFSEYNGYELPYDDNSFNLITCLMILHHIPPINLEKLMDEIYRVLKKGGIIIIREHSPMNKLQEMCLDIMHDFYDLVWNADSNMSWNESSNNYKNSNEWIDIFLNSSFVVDVKPYVHRNIDTNPFMSYFCSFRKPA